MMHYRRYNTIATSGNRSSRSFAFGFVVLLHVCLIIAVSNGLDIRVPFVKHYDTNTWVIEPPPVTPPKSPEWVPPKTKPVEHIDIPLPTVSVTNEQGSGITPTVIPARTIEPEKNIAPSITPPRSDARRPLSQPAYPASARRAGVEGTVELSLYVLANGRIGEAKIARSSGSFELDDAAVKEALRTWRLLPQQVDGVATAAWHNIAVTFRLKN